MIALLSLRLPGRECFSPFAAFLSCAIIKMSRDIQPSHNKGGRREEEKMAKPSTMADPFLPP